MVNEKTVQMNECTPSLAAKERTDAPAPEAGNLMSIVAHYQGPLLRYVGRMLGKIDDQGEDVVQETFIRLHRQINAHGPDSIQHLTTWLFRVAHNLTMDVLRQRTRQDTAQISMDPAVVAQEQAQEIDAVGEAIRQEARQRALDELAQLDELYRQAVLLKVVQGMTLRQVAEVAGVSISTVNHRLGQGLSILAQRLRRAGVV
jgi:RNA polymerase sigma-70 factor (ECF subfamily)